jgi:hypothetical protein
MRTAFFLFAFFTFASSLYPCTCAERSIEQEFRDASAIFSGKVVQIEKIEDKLKVQLEVREIWKGENHPSITLETLSETAACGYPFVTDKTYLVYATGKELLTTGICSRTKKTEDAADDFRLLDELTGKNSISTSSTPRRDPFNPMRGDRAAPSKSVPKTLNVTNAVVIGITRKQEQYLALIRAANGHVYTMKAGDRLYDGKIVNIDSNTVTFAQYSGTKTYTVKKKLHPFE